MKVFLILHHETLPMASQESGSTLPVRATQPQAHLLTRHTQMKLRETRDNMSVI